MKLRGKMQLIIGAIVAVMLMALGIISTQISYQALIDNVKSNMESSTEVGGNNVKSLLAIYSSIAETTGRDVVLLSGATNEAKGNRIDDLAEHYGFTSGNILDINGVSLKDGTDFGDRAYVQKALAGEVNISDITLSKLTGAYGFSVAAPLITSGGEVQGVVYYRMDVDFMDAIVASMKVSDNSIAYIVDKDSKVIVHPNKDLINELVLADEPGSLGEIGKAITAGKAGDGTYEADGAEYICAYAPIDGTDGWTMVIEAPSRDFRKITNGILKQMGIIEVILIIVSAFIAGLYAVNISKKVEYSVGELVKVADGDFSSDIKRSTSKDELGLLINTTSDLQQTMKGIVGETNKILGAMASYDLTSADMTSYPGEFNSIAVSVNNIKAILKDIISEVKETANHVGVGSKELSDAAENLSAGTVAQANSIVMVATDVDDMAASVANISESGKKVNDQLSDLNEQINIGNSEMTTLLDIVKDVESMSNDIRKIVGAIDSIAFQTNILALNAAVESASAGEHGRGFAVVADEIGNLANKCSDSSKQTEELIGKVIARVKQAKTSADSTFASLSKVVDSASVISEAFDKINKDTTEQAARSVNVKNEVNKISDVVQNNTAAAEETAAASETLSDQALNLKDVINRFVI